MNFYTLVFQQQNRYKFWNWDELFYYTKLTPSQIKEIVDKKKYELNDPLSSLVFSYKNHEQRALDNIFDNYTNSGNFELSYNEYGLSTNFILQAQNPIWQNYNSNTDWYWKQNWIYKYGQLLKIFPGVKNIYLSCSSALENSHDGSDIDLMIQVHKNFVWITKPYFAIISKALKYYDLNFLKAAFYFVTNQIKMLDDLKHKNTEHKIKIDFGLVFECQSQLEKYYSNKERNLFIWSALGLNSKLEERLPFQDVSQPISNQPQRIFRLSWRGSSLGDPDLHFSLAQDDGYILDETFKISNSIQTKVPFNQFMLKAIQILLYPTLFIIAPLGLLNFLYEQKHRDNYNKLVLWNIYSQYNLIY